MTVFQLLLKCWKIFFGDTFLGKWFPCHSESLLCMCQFSGDLDGSFAGSLEQAKGLKAFKDVLCVTTEAVAYICPMIPVKF